jgi:hypothetical protein
MLYSWSQLWGLEFAQPFIITVRISFNPKKGQSVERLVAGKMDVRLV